MYCRHIWYLQASQDFERLAGIASKILKPLVLKRLRLALSEEPLLAALADACNTSMASCLALVEHACTESMGFAEQVRTADAL